jgi:hypothetical protein
LCLELLTEVYVRLRRVREANGRVKPTLGKLLYCPLVAKSEGGECQKESCKTPFDLLFLQLEFGACKK